MNIKRLFAVMSATALAASCFALSASAATNLTDLVYPVDKDEADMTEEEKAANEAYYSIGAMGFYMNTSWTWNQGDWVGIDADGIIDVTYDINKVLADPTMEGKGTLGSMGLLVCNLPEEGYPYTVSVLEATFTADDGNVIELETAKAITEATKHPEGNFRIVLRPTAGDNDAATPELAGMDEEGKFNGGTLHIKLDFGKKAANDSSSQSDSSSASDSSSTSDSSSKSDSSSASSSSSSSSSTSSTKGGTTSKSTTGGSTTTAGGTAAASSAASDATESSGTGAAAGIALAVSAIAASAIVVSKKRH